MNTRYIGQQGFSVTPEGVVVRALITSLVYEKGRIVVNHGNTFFDAFSQAQTCAEKILEKIRSSSDSVTARIRANNYIATLRTGITEENLKTASFPIESPLPDMIKLRAGFQLPANTVIPKNKFEIGQEVYAIITPYTHYTMVPKWTTPLYFLLQLDVLAISLGLFKPLRCNYSLGRGEQCTQYGLGETRLFLDQDTARTRLVSIFADETRGTIDPKNVPIIPVEEEFAANKKMWEKMMASRKPLTESLG